MVSFEKFVKSMPPSLSELKVTPSFCFAFKIPDNPTATNIYDLCTLFVKLEIKKVLMKLLSTYLCPTNGHRRHI